MSQQKIEVIDRTKGNNQGPNSRVRMGETVIPILRIVEEEIKDPISNTSNGSISNTSNGQII